MRISKFIIGLSLFFLTGIVPVFAQSLTILPSVGENVNCAKLLQDYELTGKIPTMAETDEKVQKAQNEANAAEQNYKKTENDYNAAQKAYENANNSYDQVTKKMDTGDILDCNSGNLTTPSVCNKYKQKQQDLNNAQQQLDEAKQKSDEAKQKNDEAQKNTHEAVQAINQGDKSKNPDRDSLLACGIKTGRISLQMVPYFITRIANFILSLISLLCVLFIVIGGYQYIVGGLTDQKEKGKNTIKHALMGMSIAILSWVIVTAVMNAITG